MNLLDTASLVVTPNGYKASKLYSIVPSDGTGDMTFARTGDTATRVNSSGLIESVLANKPRLDYTDSTCPKLLLEPQRTNLTPYSNNFTDASWTNSSTTITANYAASPDGTTNASRFQQTTVGALQKTISVTASTTYTVSFYCKRLGGTSASLGVYNLSAGNFIFQDNLFSTLTLNTWVRVTRTFTTPVGCTSITNEFWRDSTIDCLIYGMQLEAGAYATSYIPTTTASVTRNGDNCSKTSINSLIGGTSGTILFNITTNPTLTTAIYKQFAYYLSATSQQEYMHVNQNNRIVTSPSWGSMVSSNTLLPSTTYKVALGFSPLNHVLYVNGVQVAISTTGTPYDSDKITSLLSYNGTDEFGEFKLNSFAHWKTKLTNQELVTLTTI
jgi:hypothetical protein